MIARRFFPKAGRATLWRWMLTGNAASYAFLLLLVIALPYLEIGPYVRWLYAALYPEISFLIGTLFKVVHAFRGPPGGP